MPHDATWLYLKRSRYSFVFGYFHHVRTAHQEDYYSISRELWSSTTSIPLYVCLAAAVVVYFVDWNRESWHPREALLALILMTRQPPWGLKGSSSSLQPPSKSTFVHAQGLGIPWVCWYLIEPELNMSSTYILDGMLKINFFSPLIIDEFEPPE